MAREQSSVRQARERLLRLERQAKARAEARSVMEGVTETVTLCRARGAAIETPAAGRRRVCAQPYRRQSGLDWLGARAGSRRRRRRPASATARPTAG
jgi:hypothetical protein